MNYKNDQMKEIETIRERTIEIKLSDADVLRIWKKVGVFGLTVSELLENFVGDLVDGTYSNGSDERDLVQQWFDRCGFGMFPDRTFLSYLIEQENVEDFLELFNNIKSSEKIISIMEEEIETGVIKGRDESIYTWKDLITCSAQGDNPSYSSKDDWEKALQEDIEQEKEFITDCQEEMEEYWNVFLQYSNGKKGTFDKEVEKVLKWYGEMEFMKDQSKRA